MGLLLLALLAGCNRDPLEKGRELMAAGGCPAALPEVEPLVTRQDRVGVGARAMVATCRFEAARSAEAATEEQWRDVIALMDGSLRETATLDLPPGVQPVDPGSLARAVGHASTLAMERGAPDEALDLVEASSDLVDYPDDLLSVRARAHLELAHWSRGAALLERAGKSEVLTDEERLLSLRLASVAWYRADQPEKALALFSRAQNLEPAGYHYPLRLIDEGQELEHVLEELIAASVHGVLRTAFERDFDELQDDPVAFNFFVGQRDKAFLEAREVIETLEDAVASGGDDQFSRAAPWLLYHVLNMRGLLFVAGGDIESAREDLIRARDLYDPSPEAEANLQLLQFWTY